MPRTSQPGRRVSSRLLDVLFAFRPGRPRLTLADPARLQRALAECRDTGIAFVREETTPGVDSVATRVLNADGEVVAALSAVVRTGSVDLRTVTPAVAASGLAISRGLGWRPTAGVRHAAANP